MSSRTEEKHRCLYDNFIPKLLGVQAIVIWPFVLFAHRTPSLIIIAHEFIHMDQIQKDGVFTFYLRYLYEYLQGRLSGKSRYRAYREISYEKEAFEGARARAQSLKEEGFSHTSEAL